MKVFSSMLVCLVLCSSAVHARFAHRSRYYTDLARQQEELRNRLTMEQGWRHENKYSNARINSASQPQCSFARPQPGVGVQVPSAVTVCNEGGKVCHHTMLFRCCDLPVELEAEKRISEQQTLVVGGRTVNVNFFYAGGFGSRQPLSVCFTIEGSDELCNANLLGCNPTDSCGPNDGICEGNIQAGTCNPDPNPDNGGGCQCQPGYLSPNCCMCDFPRYFERRISDTEFTCDPICRLNCDGAPTITGCNRCQQGYQGPGCCECAPGYTKVGDRCEPFCESKCHPGDFDQATGRCSRCLPGYGPVPTCCACASGFVRVSGLCQPVCSRNCAGTVGVNGCSQCKTGWQGPTCCQCDHHYSLINGQCIRICQQNCERDYYTYRRGCSFCRPGYGPTPGCCDCASGHVWYKGQCVAICDDNCATFGVNRTCAECKPRFQTEPECCDCRSGYAGPTCSRVGICEGNCAEGTHDEIEGCGQCRTGYKTAPECCDCAEGFTRDPETGECVREVCDACVESTFDPETGCGQCEGGFAPPLCCSCPTGFISPDGMRCVPACPGFCAGEFNEAGCQSECLPGRLPPTCCPCRPGLTPTPEGPCVLTCPEGQRPEGDECVDICDPSAGERFNPATGLCEPICVEADGERFNPATGQCEPICIRENGERFDRVTGSCVSICEENERFNPDTGECEDSCVPQDEDIYFLLDYSSSFDVENFRSIIGSLQLVSAAIRESSQLRAAVVIYEVQGSELFNGPSRFMFNFTSSCLNQVNQLDFLASNGLINGGRSRVTASYTALELVARQSINPNVQTSIVTITDGFSIGGANRLTLIQNHINTIKAASQNPQTGNTNAEFFSIGIDANGEGRSNIEEELLALADNIPDHTEFIQFEEFIDTFLDLLLGAGVLCQSQVQEIRSALSESNLNDFITCHAQSMFDCAERKLGVSCQGNSRAKSMNWGQKNSIKNQSAEEKKDSLMTEILSAVQKVFNNAFSSE